MKVSQAERWGHSLYYVSLAPDIYVNTYFKIRGGSEGTTMVSSLFNLSTKIRYFTVTLHVKLTICFLPALEKLFVSKKRIYNPVYMPWSAIQY